MCNKKTTLLTLFVMICITGTFISCKKESTLIPEEVYSGKPKLPQGASIYDSKIQEFYNATGCYMLYKFHNEQDLRFYMKGIPNIGMLKAPDLFAQQVDTSIQPEKDTLNLAVTYVIDSLLRKNYPDALLRQLLPYKILLFKFGRPLTVNAAKPSGFDTSAINFMINGPATNTNNLLEGFNCVGLGIVRKTSAINSGAGGSYGYSASDKAKFYKLLWLGGAFGAVGTGYGAIGRGRIPMPVSFSNLTDYGAYAAQVAQLVDATGINPLPGKFAALDSVQKNNGIISSSPIKKTIDDYLSYIDKIGSSTKQRFNDDNIYSPFGGGKLLDLKGLRAKKRDAIVNFFRQEYGFEIENCFNRQ